MQITDNKAAKRFEIHIDRRIAWLDYDRGNRTLDILHTDVPSALSGQGIGTALVRHAIEVARDEQLTLMSHCSFSTAYLQKHGLMPPADRE
ncbi:GNAT family N-acetyltransferase [Acetobacter fallax]|uniref:N-acetyltransferase n=1 Tax=Acetobacter fallax TaxID=1737473 RepID=A0ABX0KEM1_9PROT|nr:GNAT family N-acetyltransferase [Acetobacter fallax]NHO32895.1 N-acetyltransferase [Acetobacter fallax]NHO36457.1 N-acetyltransferase [Acetobacter fallax]